MGFISVTLISLVLGSALVANYVGTVQAQASLTFYAKLCPDPYWGYYGGYHDIWYTMKDELAKIGIDINITILPNKYSLWYLMCDVNSYDWIKPITAGYWGWDLTILEWWLMPTGMLWNDGIVYGIDPCGLPPYGFNDWAYLNERSDWLYWMAQHTLDAETRKIYMDEWQKEIMHTNPMFINVYFPHIYHMRGKYVKGYDETAWWYDSTHLDVDVSGLTLDPAVVDRVTGGGTGNGTLIWATTEEWWYYMPFFADSRTMEQMAAMCYMTLYRLSIDPWPADGVIADPQDYISKPMLASGPPLSAAEGGKKVITDPVDGEPTWLEIIPLREGVKFSDGDPFDAADVKFTFEVALDPDNFCTSTGDFLPIVKRALFVNSTGDPDVNAGPHNPGNWDPYKIALLLQSDEPYADLENILSNCWGLDIVPYHKLATWDSVNKKFVFSGLREHASNKNLMKAREYIPALGPFQYWEEGTPAGSTWIKFKRNPNYFGYNTSYTDMAPWGPKNIEYFIIEMIEDAAERFAAIETHEIDFGEYPAAPIEVFESMKAKQDLLTYETFYVASNPVWLNFKNPHLNSIYVKKAIAHSIPYSKILNEILPGYGVKDPIPGTSLVLPWQYYTDPPAYGSDTVHLYNSALELYDYDLAKAQAYLDLYLDSWIGAGANVGPKGDADFSGLVDLDDLWIWLTKYNTAPVDIKVDNAVAATTWTVLPLEGRTELPADFQTAWNVVDPDFDNDGDVDLDDLSAWIANVGKEYPFPEDI